MIVYPERRNNKVGQSERARNRPCLSFGGKLTNNSKLDDISRRVPTLFLKINVWNRHTYTLPPFGAYGAGGR